MAFNLRSPVILDSKYEALSFQSDAFREVKELPYAAIFHEQGLGKTKIGLDVALSWLEHDEVDTVFIVTKKSLVNNWQIEIDKHTHVSSSVLSGNKGSNIRLLNRAVLIYILNYEVVSGNLDLISLFLETCKVGIILDESQKIKNPDSKLTQSFIELSTKFERRIIMTGTPIANRPFDIWSQIYFLDAGKSLGNSFEDFKNRTDLPKENSQIFKTNTEVFASELAEIWNSIKSFSIRETKESSGIELPSKTIFSERLNMNGVQAKIYANYQKKLQHELMDDDGNVIVDDAESILKRLLRLIQCASNPAIIDNSYAELPIKFQYLRNKLKEISSNNNKAIVWTSFIDNVEWLSMKLAKYQPCKIHGGIDIDRRNDDLERFKNDPECQVMIATPGSAKEGLTLTVANYAIFYDRSFSLDDYLQAQDRIHRISQKQECSIINLIAKGSIDEWVESLINAKYQAARISQGDTSKDSFIEVFDFDLTELLRQVLNNDINYAE